MKLKVQVLGADEAVNGRPVLCRFSGGDVPVVDAASAGGLFSTGGQSVVVQLDVQGGNARFRSDEVGIGGRGGTIITSDEKSAIRRTCIAVVDKKAGTIRIVPLAAAADLRLHAAEASGAAPSAPDIHPGDATAPIQEKGYTQKKNELIQAFGAKRRARAARSVQANRVDQDKLTATEVNAVMQSVEIAKTPQGPSDDAPATPTVQTENPPPPGIPAHDVTATTPALAYPLRGLISPSEWSSIENLAIGHAKDPNHPSSTNESQPNIEALWFPLAQVLRDGTDNGTKMTSHHIARWMALVHLEQVLTFSENPTGVMKSGILPPATSEKLRSKFAEESTSRRGLVIPDRAKDRLIYHALALWLCVVDYGGDPCDIAKALGLEEIRALVYLKHLGCQVRRVRLEGQKRSYAELTVPLVFPATARRQPRTRG